MDYKLRANPSFNDGVMSVTRTEYARHSLAKQYDSEAFKLGVAEGEKILKEGCPWENASIGEIWLLELQDKTSSTYVFKETSVGVSNRFYPVTTIGDADLGAKATLIISGIKIWPLDKIDW